MGWLFTHSLGKIVSESDFAGRSRSWIDEWLLGKIVAGTLQDLGLDEGAAEWRVLVIKLLITHQLWFEALAGGEEPAYQVLESWLRDDEVHQFLQVNRYQDVLWFNKESFNELLSWMQLIAEVQIKADPDRSAAEVARALAGVHQVIKRLQQAEGESEYQVEELLAATKG